MSKALELRQERFGLVERMKVLVEKTDRASTEEWSRLDTAQEQLRGQIERLEKADNLSREMNRAYGDPQRPPVGEQRGMNQHRTMSQSEETRSLPEYSRAFDRWVRTGDASELRTYTPLGSVDSADGSTLVPVGFQKELEVTLKSYAGMRQACRILTTASGEPISWPTMSDETNQGEFVDENAPVDQLNPTFSNLTLGSSLISSKQVLVPVQLLQDSAMSVESILAEAFGIRIGRTANDAFTTGSSPIVGILTALVSTGGRNVLAVGGNSNSGNAGDNDLNTVGTDDFSNLIAAVDPAYRLNAAFMANQSTYDSVRKLKDQFGRPVWEVSLNQGDPEKVFGFPYFVNQSMAAIGAGAKSLMFGDFSKYVIRDVSGITVVRFNELFMSNHQVGFMAFLRTEGKLLQPKAFAYLQHPLS